VLLLASRDNIRIGVGVMPFECAEEEDLTVAARSGA